MPTIERLVQQAATRVTLPDARRSLSASNAKRRVISRRILKRSDSSLAELMMDFPDPARQGRPLLRSATAGESAVPYSLGRVDQFASSSYVRRKRGVSYQRDPIG